MRFGLIEITDASPGPMMPITLEQAKKHLRVDFDDDDSLISDIIRAATAYAERYTNRAYAEREYRLTLDGFPTGGYINSYAPQDGEVWPPRFGNLSRAVHFPDAIVLPVAPLLSVTSISYKYLDTDGTVKIGTVASYLYTTAQEPPYIVPTYGVPWPDTVAVPEAVIVDFVAGGTVPDDVLSAIKLMIGHLYEHREATLVGISGSALPMGVNALLSHHRMFTL